MSRSPIDFKDPKWALTWIDTALEMEKAEICQVPGET